MSSNRRVSEENVCWALKRVIDEPMESPERVHDSLWEDLLRAFDDWELIRIKINEQESAGKLTRCNRRTCVHNRDSFCSRLKYYKNYRCETCRLFCEPTEPEGKGYKEYRFKHRVPGSAYSNFR